MASRKHHSNFKSLLRTGSLEETSTNSASLAEAERNVKFLEKENKVLREEIAEIKSMYIQLTKESSHEKYDERRVNFLKAQMIQLERQILLLNEALGGRMAVLLEAENALQIIVERCRHCEQKADRIGEAHISKEDLNLIIQTAESAKLKLYKNIENTTMQRLHKPMKFMDKFVKPQHLEQLTLLDICSGEIDHINLKQVAKLESQLSQIYSQLLRVNHCLAVQVFPDSFQSTQSASQVGPQAPKANFIKLFGESSKACNQLMELLPDLLELSVLVPAAPWPMLKKRLVKELSVDSVMARLPAFSKSKAAEVREVVESLLKVISLQQMKASIQDKTYREEIKHHKSVYQLQLEYIDNLFKSLRCGYSEFEKDARTLICEPMSEVLRIYETLKITASEEALRYFLKAFKKFEPQIASAVAKLESKESDSQAFSRFGEEFFEKLYTLEIQCQEERDANIAKLQEVKEQQAEYWLEIKKMFHSNDNLQDDNKHGPQNGESNTERGSSSMSTFSSHHHNNDESYSSSVSARAEKNENTTPREEDTSKDVTLPLIQQQSQKQQKTRTSSLTRRPRSSSARRNSFANEKVQNYKDKEETSNAQRESEDLFKASLRANYDNEQGFDFTMDSEKEDSSNCTCGAEQSNDENSANQYSSNYLRKETPISDRNSSPMHREKPPSGRQDSPLHRTGRSKMQTKTTKNLVPKTRLVLRPRPKRDQSGPASDSESEQVLSHSEHMSRASVQGTGNGFADVTLQATFPYRSGDMRRSGSLPRSSSLSKKSSPWR